MRIANQSFYQSFRVTAAQTEGRWLFELGNGHWDIPRLRELLEGILPRNTRLDNFEVTREFEGQGQRSMVLNARPARRGGPATRLHSACD